MKSIALSFLFIFSFFLSNAEEINEMKIESKTEKVTVFLTGAELNVTSKVKLKKGKNLLRFIGLSSKIDAGSIVVDIDNKNIVILSVYSNNNYLREIEKDPAVVKLNDSIDLIQEQITILVDKRETLLKERNLLFQHDEFSQNQDLKKLKEYAEFSRKRRDEINMEILQIRKEETKLKDKVYAMKKQQKELNAQTSVPSAEISVLVLCGEEDGIGNFDIKYRVPNAGWAPKYDIRVEGFNKPINLFYRANVFNNTGIDWMNVKLKLSTADPMQGAQYPELEKWNLKSTSSSKSSSQRKEITQLKKDNKNIDFQTITVDDLSAEFEISTAYTIPSDSRPYIVEVSSRVLEAKYEYISVPKMEKDAYLVAKVTGWTDLSLVSGNSSIYYNGSYIGQSKINISEISDTLELSLGRDSKIAINRVKKTEMNDHQILGNYEKETFKYEITVRNNRDIAIPIKIVDQVPLQNDSRITINFNEITGGIYNKSTGEVYWKLNLQPGETKVIIFNFSIKYPKEMKLVKKKTYRTISAPSF